MSRLLLYVAHPLSPTPEQVAELDYHPEPFATALRNNLQNAMRWLSWLRQQFPDITFISPWIASVMSGEDDSKPSQREAGLLDDCTVIERCDGIVMCGGRISSGMSRERDYGIAHAWCELWAKSGTHPFMVFDLTGCGLTPGGEATDGDAVFALSWLGGGGQDGAGDRASPERATRTDMNHTRGRTMTPAQNRTNAAWLRNQMGDLRHAVGLRNIPHEELQQALSDILDGKPWRGAA